MFSQFPQQSQIDGRLTPANDHASKTIAGAIVGLLRHSTDNKIISLAASSDNNNSPPLIDDLVSKSNSTSSSASATPVAVHSLDTMPSPPLSPYTKNATLETGNSSKFTALINTPSAAVNKTQEAFQESKTDESVADDSKKRSFPVEDMKDSSLCLDPYNDLKAPGFKRRQLNFLSQYKLISSKPSVATIRRQHHPRSAMSSTYSTVPRVRYYGSDTDTASERPRTRRVVKETFVSLESDDNHSVISRPSTPRKRKPAARRFDSPVSSSSAPPYNFDYKQIEDFSPPLSTLPNNPRALKTEWKGQSMDLSDDPLLSELHPAEVQLASTLRLPCMVYLDSKRRIFAEKVKRSRAGLAFRRTDAQKSCKIDVNKASRLYASFEKVGWLEDSNFKKYL